MDIGSILSTIISPITIMIDEVFTSDDERLQAKNKLAEIEKAASLKLIDYEKNIIDKKAEIMVAELKQDDKYTKRARPTIIYMGLIVLVVNNVLLPWISHFIGSAPPAIAIPAEFWYAWAGVTGVYAFGRTKEKLNGNT